MFVKVSKSLIFLVKSFLGNFYRHLAIFYWSHWHHRKWENNDFKSERERRTIHRFLTLEVANALSWHDKHYSECVELDTQRRQRSVLLPLQNWMFRSSRMCTVSLFLTRGLVTFVTHFLLSYFTELFCRVLCISQFDQCWPNLFEISQVKIGDAKN